MILFNTTVSVPTDVIRQIGLEITQSAMREICSRNFTMDDAALIEYILENAAFTVAAKSEKSCEGWTLEKRQAEVIANELRNGRKIMAIKEFRSATGADLRSAKLFLDKFGCSEIGATEFLAVFV